MNMSFSLYIKKTIWRNRINFLEVDDFTLAEDITDYTDETDVSNAVTMEEFDSKISRIEQLRTSYRRLHN